MQPILLNGCASATTAREARFRIDAPVTLRRAAQVVALDGAAARLAERVAGQGWAGARFALTVSGDPDALILHAADGTTATLDEALGDADVVVLVASASGAGELARSACVAIGDACFLRGTMTAGIVLDDAPVEPAVAVLRPHARVLLITSDEGDLSELLTALRA
jgi:hypothetical protein